MHNATTDQPPVVAPHLLTAFSKFLELTDDPVRLNLTLNRLFFDMLQAKPLLNADELGDLQALSELLIQCQTRH